MPDETTISPAYLRQRLRYEPETGKLYWLHYGAQRKEWNTQWAGREAFTARKAHGHLHGRLDWEAHMAHRVAWALHYGEWPKGTVDHIDGDPSNNRIRNLRDVTQLENCRNQRPRKNNTSGFMGVSWFKGRPGCVGGWSAYIMVRRKKHHLGHFNCLGKAIRARRAAELEFGFHANHGRGPATVSASKGST